MQTANSRQGDAKGHLAIDEKPAQDFSGASAQKDELETPEVCPFCGGCEVELFSLFGSQLLTAEYYCRSCRTVFEQVKR